MKVSIVHSFPKAARPFRHDGRLRLGKARQTSLCARLARPSFLVTCPLFLVFVLASCSTTKYIGEGEILYTGQKTTKIINPTPTETGETALEEIYAALATAPNNSILGSSTLRSPLPFGLWTYTGFYNADRKFGKWIFKHFAAKPVLMSTANPDIRKVAAENILREYGYFNGRVTYQTFPNKRDSLKAKLQYTVDMRNPYVIDTVYYQGFSPRTMQILDSRAGRRRTLLRKGTQFNVIDLDEERTRLSDLLRNIGLYYFRPDYMTYQADTTQVPGGHVTLRLIPVDGMPEVAEKPFHMGNTSVYLMTKTGERPNDSIDYKGLRIYYKDKLKVRPNMLYRWQNYQGFRMKRQMTDSAGLSRQQKMEGLYSAYRQTRIQNRLTNIGIFSYTELQNTPRDPTYVNDTLDLRIIAILDKPYDAELDFNVKMKSNNQTGPGAAFTVTKNNVFGGGETWNVKLEGSYEWQTGANSSSDMNSYEIALSTALTFPRIVFPYMGRREYDFAATSTFKLYIDQLNRAKYYKLLSFGGSMTYEFQPKTTSKWSFTPFKLTFNVLRDATEEFQELQEENPALYISLRDQFIPAMELTYTYDQSALPNVRHPIWWQTTLGSAGNITSLIYQALGQSLTESDKELLGVPFAQFLKLNSELRYNRHLTKSTSLAARVAAGVIWSYGNASTAPYTEQFYIGGANSVRAFSARYAGPGGYPADDDNKYSFINHVGDIRFEANLEYRFPLVSDLHGAIFLDAGNVWLLREDESRPGGKFSLKDFPDQIALGTGFGLRYDMGILVFRLDLGIGLHYPYDTGKSGYYNIPKFKDSMAIHFAIGYPF